jgi:hypothetical protein
MATGKYLSGGVSRAYILFNTAYLAGVTCKLRTTQPSHKPVKVKRMTGKMPGTAVRNNINKRGDCHPTGVPDTRLTEWRRACHLTVFK